MKTRLPLIAALLLPVTAHAGLREVAQDHILPGYAAFAQATANLAATAETDCTGDATRAAYQQAFDAWMGISHIQFGPIEDMNLSLAIAYWPDTKNRTGKALAGLIAAEDPIAYDRAAYREVSIAAQGFFALERLLYDPSIDASDYVCALTGSIAGGLADTATMLSDAWVDYADVLATPGPDNPAYPTPEDAARKVFTALNSGLEFDRDTRLGRPLGTFDRPRPTRAEARLSARSQRNVELSLAALQDLAEKLADDPIPGTLARFDIARTSASDLDDPVFDGVDTPMQRFRVEALQQDVRDIQTVMATEIGAALGVSAGFNSLDGD
ncbi:MAG: imelysin peptidase [Rhodobacteraceae bacterium]|nr:imelysin peptidase [Paracoccaceae bacterium]